MGKFDDGWGAYRERVFTNQKELGWIPENTTLTSRADSMASWESIPDSEKPFQRRLMGVSSTVTMEVDAPEDANRFLYALAGFSGGLTCYVKDSILCYEFNLFEIERTKVRSENKLPVGKTKIEVISDLTDKIGGPIKITLFQTQTDTYSLTARY